MDTNTTPTTPTTPDQPAKPLSLAAGMRLLRERRAALTGKPLPPGPTAIRGRQTTDGRPTPSATATPATPTLRGVEASTIRTTGPALPDRPLVPARYLERNDSADDFIKRWSPEPIARHPRFVAVVAEARTRGDTIRRLSRVGAYTANPMLTAAHIVRLAKALGIEDVVEFAEGVSGVNAQPEQSGYAAADGRGKDDATWTERLAVRYV